MKGIYTKSENFEIIDTIGVPHPYMITHHHVTYASDNHSGMLGKAAIEGAERAGKMCGLCKGGLAYADHKQALVVSCRGPLQIDGENNPELEEFLLANKDECERNNYEGFAFVDRRVDG